MMGVLKDNHLCWFSMVLLTAGPHWDTIKLGQDTQCFTFWQKHKDEHFPECYNHFFIGLWMQIYNHMQHDLQRCTKNQLFPSVSNLLLGRPTISLHLLSLWSELIPKRFGFSRMITKREQKKANGCGFTLSETHTDGRVPFFKETLNAERETF